MAPPCAAFFQWPQCNRLNPAARRTWLRTRVTGMRLAKLSADVARFQREHGHFFVVENPYGSEMWKLPFWESILNSRGCFAVKVQMCAAGLKDPLDPNFYIQKDTWIVSNSQEILEPLEGLRCPGVSANHCHRHNEQSRRSEQTQVCPQRFCEKLAR